MNKILALIFLGILSSCTGSGGGGSSNGGGGSPLPPIVPPGPLIPPIFSLESSEITNQSKALVTFKTNDKDVSFKVYKDAACLNLIKNFTPNSLVEVVEIPLVLNSTNEFYLEVFKSNTKVTSCIKKGEIIQDQTPPEAPVPLFFYSQSGQTGQSQITTGGDLDDFSEKIKTVKYYYLRTYNDSNKILVKEVSIEEYLSRSVALSLPIGEVSFFKISAIDDAGNESSLSASQAIFDQTTQGLAAPVLNYDVEELNNQATNINNIVLKGFVSVKATSVAVYSDSAKNNKIAEISADAFIDSGFNLTLQANSLNEYYLVAKNSNAESSSLKFSITHDSISPDAPVVDPTVISEPTYELSESVADISGQVSLDVKQIVVFKDSALTEAYSYGEVENGYFAIYPPFYQYGENKFFLVAIDAAGNYSPAVELTFEYLDYDEP